MASDLTVLGSAPGEHGQMRLVSADIAFGIASPFTEKLDDLAAGDIVMACWIEVLAAFNAGTTNVLVLGTAADDDKYLAAGDVTEATPGTYPATVKQAFAAEAAAGVLNVKYTQTGTAATTGSARAYALISKAAA